MWVMDSGLGVQGARRPPAAGAGRAAPQRRYARDSPAKRGEMICTSLSSCASILLQLLAYGISNGAVIALNALGVTLVYSVVRTVNFAYGDLFALSTVLVT